MFIVLKLSSIVGAGISAPLVKGVKELVS